MTAPDIISLILKVLSYGFLGYSILYTTLLVTYVTVGWITLYVRRHKRKFKNFLVNDIFVPISIIVPAYNEEMTIVGSIKSMLKLDYSLYEIVIIDDGSKDQTSQKIIDEFQMHRIYRPIHKMIKCQTEEYIYETYTERVPITLVRKKNGGAKADAINMGINVCKYPYFICVDADSILQANSLREIVAPVAEDDAVVAVGGAIRILNDVTIKEGIVENYRIPRKWLGLTRADNK